MDSTYKILEQATHRTLHAHSFSRSSSQASLVLTDLLSRYLSLLSLTCAKYAQHAGRTGLTARDAFCALDELGVSMEELDEYCTSEGIELGRYAVHSARRVEDLNELKGQSGRAVCTSRFHIHLYSTPGQWVEARQARYTLALRASIELDRRERRRRRR
jgi:Wiskott-Aldrich syndrome protein